MTMSKTKKTAITLLVLFVVVCSWYRPITQLAAESVDAGLQRSLISFASARALNGVISVLQGTEVAVHPMGFGVSLSIGEILDPINDLVESLSSVMLMASVAFGIQKLLLTIGSNWTVSALVTAVALLWCLLFVRRSAPPWLGSLMLALLFVRFVMPATMIGSAYVFEQFAADEYQQSQAALDSTSTKLKAFSLDEVGGDGKITAPAGGSPPPAADPEAKATGLFDRLGDTMAAMGKSATDTLSSFKAPTDRMKKKYDDLKAAAESAAERMIRLIVVFLMQTVVVPLLLLWGLYRLTVGRPPRSAPTPI